MCYFRPSSLVWWPISVLRYLSFILFFLKVHFSPELSLIKELTQQWWRMKPESWSWTASSLPSGPRDALVFLSSGHYGSSNYFKRFLLLPGPLRDPSHSSWISLFIYCVVESKGLRPKNPFQIKLIKPHSAEMKAIRGQCLTPGCLVSASSKYPSFWLLFLLLNTLGGWFHRSSQALIEQWHTDKNKGEVPQLII